MEQAIQLVLEMVELEVGVEVLEVHLQVVEDQVV